MLISKVLNKGIVNLNKAWWNLRIYEVGYRGEPISVDYRKPPTPVDKDAVDDLKDTLKREYHEQEKVFVDKYGTIIDAWTRDKINAKYTKMPNKPKRYKLDGTLEKRRANIGNLLHNNRTVEDSLKNIIRGERWD